MPPERPVRAATVLSIRGPIDRDEIPHLCERALEVLAQAEGPVVCDVSSLEPDAVSADALARLRLLAKRANRDIWFAFAWDDLKDLLCWMGLAGVARFDEAVKPNSSLTLGGEREAEQRE